LLLLFFVHTKLYSTLYI